jgi:hypothetical protein
MEKMPKNAEKIECENCSFICYKQSNYDKHLLTAKHKNRTILNNLEQKMPKNAKQLFLCDCGKKYTARNSFWYHKQKCNTTQENIDEIKADLTDTTVMLHILKQNDEFKQLIIEQNKTIL